MGRISKWEKIVKPILEEYPAARSDDRLLYYWVLKKQGFDLSVTVSRFLLGVDYPNWETITRVRRKLQENYPELREPSNVQKMRNQAEEEFIEYART